MASFASTVVSDPDFEPLDADHDNLRSFWRQRGVHNHQPRTLCSRRANEAGRDQEAPDAASAVQIQLGFRLRPDVIWAFPFS